MKQHFLLLIIAHCLLCLSSIHGQDDLSWASKEKTSFKPEVHHPNIKSVSLFAANPEIVTPVGIAVAPDGRVFVQENHTHKRDSSYHGPKRTGFLFLKTKTRTVSPRTDRSSTKATRLARTCCLGPMDIFM